MGRKQSPVIENSLAGRVRSLRRAKGWTQVQLAEHAGVSQQAVSFIENNKIRQPRELVMIAKVLDTTPAWLQFGTHEIEKLDTDAINLAISWQSLDEPLKSSIRQLVADAKKQAPKIKK